MRQINLLIIHCSATKENQSFTLQALEASHRKRGFNGIGYHYYIRQSGEMVNTRPLSRIVAHVKQQKYSSILQCFRVSDIQPVLLKDSDGDSSVIRLRCF